MMMERMAEMEDVFGKVKKTGMNRKKYMNTSMHEHASTGSRERENVTSSGQHVDLDTFYFDGTFLKMLLETLQKNVIALESEKLKLALTTECVEYLSERLNQALSPKRSNVTGIIQGWTIHAANYSSNGRIKTLPFENISNDLKMQTILSPHTVTRQYSDSSDSFQTTSSGHLDVLKLSTLLKEIKCMKLTESKKNSQIQQGYSYAIDIFPSLVMLEILDTPESTLKKLHVFSNQLEVSKFMPSM